MERLAFAAAGSGTSSTLFTSLRNTTVKNIFIVNTAAVERQVFLNVVPSSGTAEAANRFFDYILAASSVLNQPIEFPMWGGETFQAQADGAGVNVVVAGER